MAEPNIPQLRNWLHNQIDGAIGFIVLAVFFVAPRIIGVRLAKGKKKQSVPFGWDDELILCSLIAFLSLCICAISTYP